MYPLISLLEKNNIDFEWIEHSKVIKSAQEGAEYFGIEIGQTAPTLILNTNLGYYALIISGDYGRVNLNDMKELLNVQEIRFAKPKEVEQVTGAQIGSVSLINPGLRTIFDRGLYRYSYIYGGTGVPHSTLKIRPQHTEKINDVINYIT